MITFVLAISLIANLVLGLSVLTIIGLYYIIGQDNG
jgi:hypothetical protein